MKTSLAVTFVAFFAVASSVPTPQPEKTSGEPLADQVRKAINRGVNYLKDHQHNDSGSWEDKLPTLGYPGGQTALVLLALLNAGVKPDDMVVKQGLQYLRKIEKPSTYVRSLQTLVYVDAGQPQDLQRIRENVDHLLKIARRDAGGNLLGWGYDKVEGGGVPDNSNTQYALLALWMSRKTGGVDKEFWGQVRDFLVRTQTKDHGWKYSNYGEKGPGNGGELLTMTSAGLSGLYMAEMELSTGREHLDPVAICGIYPENNAIKNGLAWVSSPLPGGIDNFRIEQNPSTFYNLYGIERLGRLSGQRFLGPHDWYREGCIWLVQKQKKEDGSWSIAQSFDIFPNISTSFALLFLSKGRTPVLISKLAFGRQDTKRQDDQDWNRRHNDMRNLVEYVSAEVFRKLPLAWQTFDVRRQSNVTPQKLDELTAELLQSPILYLTGHESPADRLSGVEKALLKKYVDNGGFILGVACCGHREFSDGFEKLCRELWPDNELTNLEFDHPVWNMPNPVKPGSFGLKGIQMGCKTVAILSQENLCGFWEINRHTGEGDVAFKLGANIVAYATGLEAPKPRLTRVVLEGGIKDNPLAATPRGYFQVGQLIGQVGDEAAWTPAPLAMSRLIENLREVAGLDAVIKTANVPIDHKGLTKFKFLYMHGRNDFKFDSEKLSKLRFNLKNGGLLLADACCGHEAFDKGFRQFMADLFPKDAFPAGDTPRLIPIRADDLLFSKSLNGEALTDNNIECRTERGQPAKRMRPALEGVKIGERWAVIYSKYDIGCALEKHQSADCLGYTHDSALRLGRAAVLYLFRP